MSSYARVARAEALSHPDSAIRVEQAVQGFPQSEQGHLLAQVMGGASVRAAGEWFPYRFNSICNYHIATLQPVYRGNSGVPG